MNEIVRSKRPAAVTYGPRVMLTGELAVLTHRTRAGLITSIRQRQARGEFAAVHGDSLRFEDGVYMVDVRLAPLPDFRPRTRWRRPLMAIAVLALSVGLLAALGWWLATALAALPAALLLILAVVGLLMLTRKGGRDISIIMQNNVNVR